MVKMNIKINFRVASDHKAVKTNSGYTSVPLAKQHLHSNEQAH